MVLWVGLAIVALPLATPAAASAPNPVARHPVPRRLMQRATPMCDFSSMAGAAKGRKAGGQPDPVQGLANPDRPSLGKKSASMEDLVLPYGYPLETYPVDAGDGFVLRLYRIPGGKTNSTTKADADSPKPVVLLHHGVTLASSCFVVLDPDSSMGFYLADAGFDVWMVNTRCNAYSRGNHRYRVTDQAYWESSSLDQLALIDLPSQIDYILNKTGQRSLGIIGHSQGCTLPLMLLSARPEYNEKLWLLTLLGAVTHSSLIKAAFLQQQSRTKSVQLMIKAGVGPFVPNTITTEMYKGCAQSDAHTDYCYHLVNFMFYGDSQNINFRDFYRIGATWPSTVATRNLEHWSQLWHTGNGLEMYDYGTNCSARPGGPAPFQESCNQAKYGQERPPVYDLSHITARAAIFEGDSDTMSTQADVDKLRSQWNADLVYDRVFPYTAHMDFIWARNPSMKSEVIKVLWDNVPWK